MIEIYHMPPPSPRNRHAPFPSFAVGDFLPASCTDKQTSPKHAAKLTLFSLT